MQRQGRELIGTTREIVTTVRETRLSFLAAGTAYYAFVSVFPLVLLVVAVGSLLGGDAIAQQVIGTVSGALSPSGRQLLQEAFVSESGRTSATIVGVGVLAWSGLRVFRGLTIAFGTIYGTADEETFRGQLRRASLALLALGIGVGTVVTGTVLLSEAGIAFAGFAQTSAVVVALSGLLLPVYIVLPATSVGLREAAPGAITAAVGWTVLSVVFRVYAANAGQFDVYGVVGGALLFVTWLYVGASVLLLGGVVNAVLAGPDRQLQLRSPHTSGRDPTMTGRDGAGDGTDALDREGSGQTEADQHAEVEQLRAEIERLEAEIDDRTVDRDDFESDLERYVRRRVRRGHAHGWGPYLVLLYGTVMTLGAFYFLGGGWAILAMLVIWLSTLGLYALMVLIGVATKIVGAPGRLLDRIRDWRD
ncbi:YihY/virulence factor BrkB family protein [Halorhabdus sp. CUG00001]|uniref:YihY/virulence factor BrkB family protein n=1 Tax=Halorhabdus sp. CUG00001 TaxID=2600297 RepID=UPI00131BA2EB|nr:YihY/virulence factor BrkB family protein [Halorhabdus sp. CUG00001]